MGHSLSAGGQQAGPPGQTSVRHAADRAAPARRLSRSGRHTTLMPMPAQSTPPRSSIRMPATLQGPSAVSATRSLGHFTRTLKPSSAKAAASMRLRAGAASLPRKGSACGRRRVAYILPAGEIHRRRNCPRPLVCRTACTLSHDARSPASIRVRAASRVLVTSPSRHTKGQPLLSDSMAGPSRPSGQPGSASEKRVQSSPASVIFPS